MHILSDSDGSEGYSNEQWETGDIKSFAEANAQHKSYKDLIAKANTVPLTSVFDWYKVKASEYNTTITCPFTKHSGGRERTPSFKYYPHSNTFNCFGCKTGGSAVAFVAGMESISKVKAAYKIIELCSSDVLEVNYDSINYEDKLDTLLVFSNIVREFIQANINDGNAIKYIETIAKSFDSMNTKHKLNNESLKKLIEKLDAKVKKYICL